MASREINISVSFKRNVFNDIYLPILNDTTRTQILFGGSSSGKSVFEAQRTLINLMQGGRNYLIVRNVAASLRSSVFNELQKAIYRYNLSKLFSTNKQEMTLTCKNGYQAFLKGLDDPEKLKSIVPMKGVITDIWVEEATEIKEDAYKQLVRRLRGLEGEKKRITLTFNPILKSHWIYKKWFNPIIDHTLEKQKLYRDKNLLILKTTYKDNHFLAPEDVAELENETDEYWYNVYTLGNWGVLGDVIFRNWRIEDLSDRIRYFDNIKNGLDFGYSADPAAYVRIHYDKPHKTIYIFRHLYETGLTNKDLAVRLKPVVNKERVVCDSAEPKSIEELKRRSIRAVPAAKGPDSVRFGIQWLQGQNIVIHRECQDVINEFSSYHWKKDRWGESLDVPVDKDNHAIDATRYAMEEEMLESKKRARVLGKSKLRRTAGIVGRTAYGY